MSARPDDRAPSEAAVRAEGRRLVEACLASEDQDAVDRNAFSLSEWVVAHADLLLAEPEAPRLTEEQRLRIDQVRYPWPRHVNDSKAKHAARQNTAIRDLIAILDDHFPEEPS